MKISTSLLLFSLLTPNFSRGVDVFFSSDSADGWTATAGGAVDVAPYVVTSFGNYSHPVLGVTSGGNDSGSFLPGGSLANFSGFWTAQYSFLLPANATDVRFDFTRFFADGRGVMLLNGTIISSAGLPDDGYSMYTGSMIFTEGGTPQPYTFNSPYGFVSGSVTSGFNVGGNNVIEIIVNNTATGVGGAMTGNLAWNDGTGIGISGDISYQVPEPTCAALLILAGIGFIARKAHRRLELSPK